MDANVNAETREFERFCGVSFLWRPMSGETSKTSTTRELDLRLASDMARLETGATVLSREEEYSTLYCTDEKDPLRLPELVGIDD